MNCWCKVLQDYRCSECDAKNGWHKLNLIHKNKLLAYVKILGKSEHNVQDMSVVNFISDNNLDPGMIPPDLKWAYRN